MRKPSLVVLAAGLGSRYGGLKQIDPVDEAGQIIIDYSIYDAARAGFEKIICVITEEIEADFREVIGDRISKKVDLRYAYQTLELPRGFEKPEGRVKPWGTAHAVLCAAREISEPFAVINADDFYGASSFRAIHDFAACQTDDSNFGMVGFRLENTLTENGHVSRGVCEVDGDGFLTGITERTRIAKRLGGGAYASEGDGVVELSDDAIVSMNLWAFGESCIREASARFDGFLNERLAADPLKCEFFLPSVVNGMINSGAVRVKVLPTYEKWHGVTYAQDMPRVRAAIAQMKRSGSYPDRLWGERA
jgi:NDP-sugar pyrophosphorylase family protein